MTILRHYVEPHRFAPRSFHRAGGSFGSSYYARPWTLVRDLLSEARAILRRGLRGWDDSDVWSLDSHLAAILPPMLRHLNHTKHGTPLWCFDGELTVLGHPDAAAQQEAHQRFSTWLEQKAVAFETWTQLVATLAPTTDPRWEEVRAAFHDLFCVAGHFESLWD